MSDGNMKGEADEEWKQSAGKRRGRGRVSQQPPRENFFFLFGYTLLLNYATCLFKSFCNLPILSIPSLLGFTYPL